MTISAKRAEQAITYMIESAEAYGDACAAVAQIEDGMKSTKAVLMRQSEAKSLGDREADALSHSDYVKLIGARAEAIRQQTTLKTRLKAEELVCDVFRTLEASNRRVDRVAQ